MAEPGDAEAFIRHTPFEVDVVLLGRLSPKWILRMRLVCKAWRDKLDHFVSWRHRMEPRRPLICFDRVACPDRYTLLRDYCVDSLDLRSDRLRSVLQVTDNVHCVFDEYDLDGLRDAPPINGSRVDYERMKKHGQAVVAKASILVHGSLDGHLLVSCASGWYVTNPATHQWVAVPNLSAFKVVGFYYYEYDEGGPPGEYRVLCFCADEAPEPAYAVLTVTSKQLRAIGRPISAAAPADHGLALGVEVSYLFPSIQFFYNRCLHWPPQHRQGDQMLVFDTVTEEFSWKRPPPVRDLDMRLLEYQDGRLGLSVSGFSRATVELWSLEDYQNEVWVLRHRIQLLRQMPLLLAEGRWMAGVVSEEGHVLIETRQWVLHCDRNGNLLRLFGFPPLSLRRFPVRHMLKESRVLHPMYRVPKIEGATEPTFFHGLCSDPSS